MTPEPPEPGDSIDQVPLIRLDPLGSDHYGEAARLRNAGPIVRVLLPGDVHAWVPTRHHLTEELVRNKAISRNWRNWTDLKDGRVPADWPALGMFCVDNMFTADGAEHRELRGLVSQAFTRRRIDEMRPRITAITQGHLEALPGHADDSGAVDLRQHYAYPVPMDVICELVGLPEHWRPRLRRLVDSLFRTNTSPEEAATTQRKRLALLRELIELRRREPGEDLTTALIDTHTTNPGVLTDDKLIDTLWLLVTAGHETTLNLILNAARALLTHPDQKALALAGDDSIWEQVTEEALRRDGPVGYLSAGYALQDVTTADVTIPQGALILAPYSGLGRDPDQHPDPETFDITRPPRPHLAFGAGPHFCLGAPLARLETTIALRALFTRHPDLTLAIPDSDLQPVPSLFSHSAGRLPVRLTPVP